MRGQSSSGVIIIGAGPAGIGIPVAACNTGRLDELLAGGMTMLEAGPTLGAGALAGYAINSDSHADTLLRCLDGELVERCPDLAAHPAATALAHHRGGPAPLPVVADFMAAVAHAIGGIAAEAGQPIHTGVVAAKAVRCGDHWVVTARRGDAELHFQARHLVIATGARQTAESLRSLAVAGERLWPRYRSKLVPSRMLLTAGGLAAARRHLARSPAPRIAIVGGSHSAMAAACALLHLPGIDWQPGSIAVLHRSPMRPMYLSPAHARADGFDDFTGDDVCARTGRVFPLAGFRSDARELLLRVRGLGGREREPRLRLIDLRCYDHHDAAESLRCADLIVAATGYRPRALPLYGSDGRRIRLLCQTSSSAAMVDAQSRVLDRHGTPVPGVFGIGLAAGFPLAGTHGEPSFRRQANGLALWQADIGAGIVNALLPLRTHARPPPAAIASLPAISGHAG